MRMKAWAIDVYGLREAHRQSVLARLRDAHRLYVSPLTWFPSQPARTGNGKSPAGQRAALPGTWPSSAGTRAAREAPRQARCTRPSTRFTSEACSSSKKTTNATRT